jgi:hypothetical protein
LTAYILVSAYLLLVALAATGAHAAPTRKPASQQSWQYKWWVWLPDKWQRIGACETGYGKRPGNWKHHNSSYQGAFGFATQSWDQFKPNGYPEDADQATPWQQYVVALRIYHRYGLTGWGCRNA